MKYILLISFFVIIEILTFEFAISFINTPDDFSALLGYLLLILCPIELFSFVSILNFWRK